MISSYAGFSENTSSKKTAWSQSISWLKTIKDRNTIS
ncbi:hypothetical protein NC651_007329 [Populus alba x Populus x berolinensis]|nr:hypothetical protein NC651_007329 [Populus alba x Populus x berolinensis]